MIFRLLQFVVFVLLACVSAQAQVNTNEVVSQGTTVPVLAIKGAIGPGVSDYLVEQINKANQDSNIPLILITLDTPGGLSSSLRDINTAILGSNIPVACLVYPQGARAASAGTYILYACHVAAMAPATTLGAATPVNIAAPGESPEKKEQAQSPSSMEKKMLNDAIAYMRSLAQLRKRNEQWAVLAVSEAATLTATEALAKNVVNYIADDPKALLKQLDGITLQTVNQSHTLHLANARLIQHNPDWRNQFIATITDPNIAYILMLIGIYGLILEFYSPGIGAAGITGAIALLVALYAFQLLPLNFSGAALLLLGIGLLIAESMVPSFGVLGVGGIIAFAIGSVFLIDTEQQQYRVSIPLIAAFTLVSAFFLIFALGFIWRNRHNKIVSGQEELINAKVNVCDINGGQAYVMFNGERWAACADTELAPGQQVKITALDGLRLIVTPVNNKE